MSATVTHDLDVVEVFDLYRRSALGRFAAPDDALRETWSRLLRAQPELFRIETRREPDGALAYAASAFACARGTWHLQHLVSGARDDRAGAMALLFELVRGLESTDVHSLRAAFRPDWPATTFFAAAHRAVCATTALSLVDYGIVSTPRGAAGVDVRRLRDPDAAEDFYGQLLHPAELRSLELDDLELRGVDARYRRHGLHRRRTVLAAFDGPRIAGACLVNRGPAGVNYLGLEGAVEHVRVAPHYSGTARARIWNALVGAAVQENGRSVALLHPDDRPFAVAAGIRTTRMMVVTASRDGDSFLAALRNFC